MDKTGIPEIDAFIQAEIELIGGEENEEERTQLFRIFHNGIRTILMAQLQLPSGEDEGAAERVKRRIKVVKDYLKESSNVGDK